jgi:hypothetical protein
MWERRGAYRVLVGRPEEKRPPEGPVHKWEDNIKASHQELRWGDMDWIYLAQGWDRWRVLVNVVLKFRVP